MCLALSYKYFEWCLFYIYEKCYKIVAKIIWKYEREWMSSSSCDVYDPRGQNSTNVFIFK